MMSLFPQGNILAYGVNEMQHDPPIISCKCVAFRLDDIQDYFLNQPQMEVIKTFERKNVSLTVGVIGNSFGNDAVLTEFLKTTLLNDENNLEVANHGWNHEDFTLFDKDQQSALLSKSNNKILETLGVMPQVFITPYNKMNNDTLIAMAENSMHMISASVLANNEPFVKNLTNVDGNELGSNFVIHHLPSTAETGDLNDDYTQWIGRNHAETLNEVKTSMEKYGYALVTMHPQEFSVREGLNYQNKVDGTQLLELEMLLESLRNEGYEVVTISQLANYSNVPEFSGFLYPILALPLAMVIACAKSIFQKSKLKNIGHDY
jgi:peptidoglycan/xylan/chitin deacetylase (PgdA/CDA1 family)